MDSEYLDIFTYKLLSELPHIQKYISSLEKEESVVKLFRIFHNYKASSTYLGLTNFSLLATDAENILNSIRQKEKEFTVSDKEWLENCYLQLKKWCDELLIEENLSPVNSSLLSYISILDNDEKTIKIMQELNLIYADTCSKRAKAIKEPLEHIFSSVQTTSNINILKRAISKNSVDIIILNLQDESIKTGFKLLEEKPDLALIVAVPHLRGEQKARLLIKGLNHPISSPIKSSDLKRHLHDIVTSHFAKVHTIIPHQKIYNFIQGLDPLPSSVKEISRICNDPNSSIKELSYVIESDSIASATVLHASSSAIYGIKRTSSIKQAVTSFGKRLIKAITLSDLSHRVGDMELSVYGISEEQFKKTSRIRLALMHHWYSQVNTKDLDILCSCAVLGNLGEILINQEILNEGLEEKFKSYKKNRLSKAEVDLLRTSSAFVTADILNFWGLEAELVDAIRYSDSPLNARTTKIQKLATANSIVYKIVTPYAQIQEPLSESIKHLMHKMGLKEEPLKDAISLVKEGLAQEQKDLLL